MRGSDGMQETLFTMSKLEDFVPTDHPLRAIQVLVNEALSRLNGLFNEIYADTGRASIAPEKLMRALLLQVFYSVRSERQLVEQLRYNLLFRWFVGLNMDDAVWDPTVFTKNRERLLAGDIAEAFFARVLAQARERGWLSDEHFTVDGTLIEAWASQKSFQRKDGGTDGDGRDFRGQERKNDTHASKTDPDARLFRKSKGSEAKLSYLGHVLMENRNQNHWSFAYSGLPSCGMVAVRVGVFPER